MNANPDKPSSASVSWWNERQIQVQCPFCKQIEAIEVLNKPVSSQSFYSAYQNRPWKSRCGNGSYLCSFPFDSKTTSYEIDRLNGRFINTALPPSASESDQIDDPIAQLTTAFATKTSIQDPKKFDLIATLEVEKHAVEFLPEAGIYTNAMSKLIMSAALEGQLIIARFHVSSLSTENKKLVLGSKATNGNTILINSVPNIDIEILKVLVEEGSSLNVQNHRGRSALMEAALWGRLDIVPLLLSKGADMHLMDTEGNTARDLAQPTRSNQLERHLRAGGTIDPERREPKYKEDTFNRNEDRRDIVNLLENRKEYPGPPSDSHCRSCSYKKDATTASMVLCEPTATYTWPDTLKVVAQLRRGPSYKTIVAMSGWKHTPTTWPTTFLDGRSWTDFVLSIAKGVGHNISSHEYDQGIPGQFLACHAEKQVVAYFLLHHSFFGEDIASAEDQKVSENSINQIITTLSVLEKAVNHDVYGRFHSFLDTALPPKSLTGPIPKPTTIEYMTRLIKQPESLQSVLQEIKTTCEQHISKASESLHSIRRESGLLDLARIAPPTTLKDAAILVSKDPCDDCVQFTKKVNERFGLTIRLYNCS